jgi:hypothetical protein
MPLISQQIADALDNDGQQWRTRPTDDSEPETFNELIDRHGGASVSWRDGWQTGDVCSHTFADGSVITVAGDAWDLGFPTCYCWQGAGHDDRCDADNALEIFDAITDDAHEPNADEMSHDDLVEAALAQGEHFYREIRKTEARLISSAILEWLGADNSLDRDCVRRGLRRTFDPTRS